VNVFICLWISYAEKVKFTVLFN